MSNDNIKYFIHNYLKYTNCVIIRKILKNAKKIEIIIQKVMKQKIVVVIVVVMKIIKFKICVKNINYFDFILMLNLSKLRFFASNANFFQKLNEQSIKYQKKMC